MRKEGGKNKEKVGNTTEEGGEKRTKIYTHNTHSGTEHVFGGNQKLSLSFSS